jgi:hypothetical protein
MWNKPPLLLFSPEFGAFGHFLKNSLIEENHPDDGSFFAGENRSLSII